MAWTTTTETTVCDRSGTAHTISTGLPVRHDRMDEMPLIVCMDAPWTFGTVLDATRIMSMSGEAPEAMVVGIGFAEESMGEYLRQRARWLTPTPFEPPPGSGVKGLVADDCGRASVLHEFVRDQVLPSVMADHAISERWFVGHSFSGLFGVRTMLTEPSLFDKWLLASPSIWWDDRAILQLEQAYADEHDDLAVDLFVSGGEHERDSGFSIVDDALGFVDTLNGRGYPNLRATATVLAGDGHSNCIGNAVSKGLRALL
ncbi:MAG: alpha/beta hydrolase-fold protein [Acidimicrobiales bacterium]